MRWGPSALVWPEHLDAATVCIKEQLHVVPGKLRLLRVLSGAAQVRETAAKDTSKAVVIDVTKYGLSKVLGKGQLPSQPVVVRAKFVSKLAERKIREVGVAVVRSLLLPDSIIEWHHSDCMHCKPSDQGCCTETSTQ